MLKILFATAISLIVESAKLFDYELKIVLTDHKIKLEFEDPEKESICWDSNHYVSGNIFVEGIANPIKVTKNDLEKKEIITSERYKTFMEQSLIDDMLQASSNNAMSIKAAVLALGTLQLLNLVVIFIMTGGI